MIAETFSDGTARYYTVKEGEEVTRVESSSSPEAEPAPAPSEKTPSPPLPPRQAAAPQPPPPPPPKMMLDLTCSDLAALEEQRRRIAEIEYLQEQLGFHLGDGQISRDSSFAAPLPRSFAPTNQSTPIKSTHYRFDDAASVADARSYAVTSAGASLPRYDSHQYHRLHPHDAAAAQTLERRSYHRREEQSSSPAAGAGESGRLGMPESDQHLASAGSVTRGAAPLGSAVDDVDMGDVLLSDEMSFDAIAAEIRRTMTHTGSVLGNLIEKKEKRAGGF